MRILPLLLLLFTVTPLVELTLLLRVHGAIGLGPTLALVLATGLGGAVLARWQGVRALRRTQEALAAGRMPGRELFDGALILVAGTLLVTPGVLTDALGLLLLLPPVRGLVARGLRHWAAGRVHVVSHRGPDGHGAHGHGPFGHEHRRGGGPDDDVIDVVGRPVPQEEPEALSPPRGSP